MLIWKGHGILILVFGIIGSIAAGVLTGFMFATTQWVWLGRLSMCAPFWGAAVAIWLYAKTMGRPKHRTFLDPATHRPVIITSSHSLFFIPPVPWAVLATLIASVFTFAAMVAPSSSFDLGAMTAGSSAGKNDFEKADSLISMDKGQEAYGNTADAEEMAAEFARMVKLGRQMGVQAGKKSTVSLSHGKFLTYCRINADSCAFMVHVPDLRKFSKEARDYIAEVAWAVAMQSAAQLKPQPKRLAVGIRGAFLYDAVIEGHIVAEAEDAEEGIEQRHTGGSPQTFLGPFFAPDSGNAPLPRLDLVDAPEQKIAKTTPQRTAPSAGAGSMAPSSAIPGRADFDAAPSSYQKADVLLKWFPTMKAGEVAGNADAASQLALKYAGFVHDRVSVNPALGGMALPDPCFSAYVHLRDDTVAFLLALPAGSDLSPGAIKVFQDEAWRMAAMASAQMAPIPVRIAVTTFNEGKVDLTRIGSPQNQGGTQWLVEQEMPGGESREVLVPFVAACSRPLIVIKSPLTLQTSVKSVLASNRHVRVPQTVPASAPLLPTPVREWKDATGRVMQASLESFTTSAKDTGRFKRADGQVFEVPFSRLSAEDQAFVRGLAASSNL